jgi:hypothetical protein
MYDFLGNKMRRPLHIGIQDFIKLRENGYYYADKTGRILDMIDHNDGVVFLARPRRFGKSLLCSTLAAVFEAKRELFDGLAIDKSDYNWKKYPVVRLDLNAERLFEGLFLFRDTSKYSVEKLCKEI